MVNSKSKNRWTNAKADTPSTNLVQMFPAFARAYTIALLGDFSMTVFYLADDKAGQSNYQLVKGVFSGINYTKEGLLSPTLNPPCMTNGNDTETMQIILDKVFIAKQFPLPTEIQDTKMCEIYLRRPVQLYNLGITQVDTIKKVAAVIAQLAHSELILIEHVAEALMLTVTVGGYETLINAEANSINFGEYITIGLEEKNPKDIQDAIEFLQSLLS